ncbi:hypothetical protein [Parvularcula sp. IMCC14364]|uniref:hypothetical protein n=1 Tax=Parvularcula sp. IMCC14364 TaxID=3067902 RepID=UPI002740DA54|nr:hypothetical protein [Parvularcula sp. IMCC14364]
MTKKQDPENQTKNLPKYLGLASLGAFVLLILAVLPAEYGVDPTGFGRVTGLTKLAGHHDDHGGPGEGAGIGVYTGQFKTETIRIEIEEFGEVEHKAFLSAGGGFVYSWEVEGETPNGGVYFDFHGHPASADADEYPEGFERSYGEGELAAQSGVFNAGFPGYHGWFFLNLEERPVTLTLKISGFYDNHQEMYRAVEGAIVHSAEF